MAPILEEGVTRRDIYLPKGRWRDATDSKNTVYKGRRWLRNYKADIKTLPYFIRVKNMNDAYDAIHEESDVESVS